MGSSELEFKSLNEGRNLYIRSFCPALTSLSRYLEEAAFSISISLIVFIFIWFIMVRTTVEK